MSSHLTFCLQSHVREKVLPGVQGMSSPLAGQMVFRASLFGAFGQSKRWLGTNSDGSVRALKPLDFYKAGAITGRGGGGRTAWVT